MAPAAKSAPAANAFGQPRRPTRNSRKFSANDKPSQDRPSFAEPDDYFAPKKKSSSRSTAFATPLNLLNDEEILRRFNRAPPLTKENLENLHVSQEAESPPIDSRLEDPSFLAFMRKSKSKSPEKKKPDKKKNRDKEESIHPLNLPPDELRRLSARMAQEEERPSIQMDAEMTDADAQPFTNGTTSPPPTPGTNAPGAFPTSSDDQINGDNREQAKSPTPPPHRVVPQKMDPEQCKAAGNKFFKAKDYERAIAEYSKGAKPMIGVGKIELM